MGNCRRCQSRPVWHAPPAVVGEDQGFCGPRCLGEVDSSHSKRHKLGQTLQAGRCVLRSGSSEVQGRDVKMAQPWRWIGQTHPGWLDDGLHTNLHAGIAYVLRHRVALAVLVFYSQRSVSCRERRCCFPAAFANSRKLEPRLAHPCWEELQC